MKAMVLHKVGEPLGLQDIGEPESNDHQLKLKVHTCGICRTDLHIVDGELEDPNLPLIRGHQIVGTVVKTGNSVSDFEIGDKVSIPWLGYTCGECEFCRCNQENICDNARFTGYNINGGFPNSPGRMLISAFPLPGNIPPGGPHHCSAADLLAILRCENR